MIGTDRQVFRHSFHEPERRIDPLECLLIRAGASLCKNIVLKLVHHLVCENVLEASEVAGEGKNEAMTPGFCHTTRAFAEIAGDVVLAEISA